MWLLVVQNTFECPDVDGIGNLWERGREGKKKKREKEITSKELF